MRTPFNMNAWRGDRGTNDRRWYVDAIAMLAIVGIIGVLFHWWGNAYAGLDIRNATRSLFVWLAQRWNDSGVSFGGNYSHGWLVPAVALWLAWRRRRDVADAIHHLWWPAYFVLIAGLGAHWMGFRGELPQLSGLALVAIIWAIPAFLFGRKAGQVLMFPAAYLLFAVPMGFFDEITFPLRMFATAVSAGILNGLGIPVIRIGTAIHSSIPGGGIHLEVADPCSGIRSLMAMLAVGAVVAYITQDSTFKKWVVFLAAIPLAVCGNIARILTVGVVATAFGMDAAMKVFHDYSGFVVYGVTLGALMGLTHLMQRVAPPSFSSAHTGNSGTLRYRPLFPGYLLVAGALGCTVAAVVIGSQPSTIAMPAVRMFLPETLQEWRGKELLICQNNLCQRAYTPDEIVDPGKCPVCHGPLGHLAPAERDLLPSDVTIVRKVYQRSGGPRFWVTIVIAGRGRSGIHRPEICLTGQGNRTISTSAAYAPVPGRVDLPLTILAIERYRNDTPTGEKALFGYWFTDGAGRETASHFTRIGLMAYDRIFRGTATRWAYISILIPARDNSAAQAEMTRFISALYPAVHDRK